MIGRLQGIVVEKQPPMLIVDVHGVGYEISAPMTVFFNINLNDNITLYTHFIFREDAVQLYGFISLQERNWFRTLLKVNGVGPKTALALLSTLTMSAFKEAIDNGDKHTLCKVPGIGNKTAERMLVELRTETHNMPLKSNEASQTSNRFEALSALLALGYKSKEAEHVLDRMTFSASDSSEKVIRMALSELARKMQ